MVLSSAESAAFFSNYIPLLYYVSVYEGILPEGSSMENFFDTGKALKIECRDALFNDLDILDQYEKDNATFLKTVTPGFTGNIRRGLLKNFVMLKQKKDFAVFMDAEKNVFYHVTALSDPLGKLLLYIPCLLETAIFSFKGEIVYDGLVKGGNMQLGPNYEKQFLHDYALALKNKTVLEHL